MNPVRNKIFSGGRKTAKAQVFFKPGTGKITVNKQPADKYLQLPRYLDLINIPIKLSRETFDASKYDIICNVSGGGITSQANAIMHTIAKILDKNFSARPVLKSLGLLTRDSRIKERKKYGLRKARKRQQFTKR
jgi:small subunit ribosomal protein S9